MDTTNLMLSLLFGLVGTGFVMYGKSAGNLVSICAGVALMVCPYFITNIMVMTIVCLFLTAAPFFLRET